MDHSLPMLSITSESEVFEGPEKKLDIFFRPAAPPEGLRHFAADTWAELLKDASCSILSTKENEHFDAYLLSESSLFVFPHRVILKTCGTTTLLLVLPKLIRMAEFLGSSIELLQYGHLRYKFPEQQIFPHSSIAEEQAYLARHFGTVFRSTLGPSEGCCWSMFAVESPDLKLEPMPAAPADGDDVLEIAMEGLALDVCALFSRGASSASAAGVPERELAVSMTERSGLLELLPDVAIDDWAFEPCGYSMNGLRLGYYYTVHVTPEPDFSYASFETNDPRYREPNLVQRIVSAFAPSVAVVSLTTRRAGNELPAYSLPSFECTSLEVKMLGSAASVCCANFARAAPESTTMAPMLGATEHTSEHPSCARTSGRTVEVA